MVILDYAEISDPHDVNIYTYFKLKAYVKLLNGEEGSVEKYVVDKEDKFSYGVQIVKELCNWLVLK